MAFRLGRILRNGTWDIGAGRKLPWEFFRTSVRRSKRPKPPYAAEKIWDSWIALRSFASLQSRAANYHDPEKRKQLKPAMIWEVERGLEMSAMDIHNASELRSGWLRAAAELFNSYDADRLAKCAGLSFRRHAGLAEKYQRSGDGHLSPLDGGHGASLASGPAGAQCAGRLRRRKGARWECRLSGRPALT